MQTLKWLTLLLKNQGMDLIIVESPTKAKTISKFIKGKDYKVVSSYGHIRDLPKSKMGIDVENSFNPEYEVPEDSKKTVQELKRLAKDADTIYFATDEDREGEAIAWHLNFLLKPKKEKAKRITFHEITKKAIEEALKNPRKIDQNLFDAQQGRRVLDRLVGYELSPFLWKKVTRGLSAGRVQSAAVRIVVDRENEIRKFKPDEYWSIEANLAKTNGKKEQFIAKLSKIEGKAVKKLGVKSKKQAAEIKSNLEKSEYKVLDVKKTEKKRRPLPPFTTSKMQQEASQKFGYSAKQTMRLAQQLYEGITLGAEGSVGLITYMRTDSLNLSKESIFSTQDFIKKEFGEKYTSGPRFYKTKSKGAQEAHEAIRPTDSTRTPESISSFLDPRQLKLYTLVWQRLIASQMADAIFDATTVNIDAKPKNADKNYELRANGSIIKFDGFLKVYPNSSKDTILPELTKDEMLDLLKLIAEQHFTEPPARYSEATLIKALEEQGIGRPSTYAPTMSTIQTRGYVEKNEEKKLAPTDIGELVNKVLVEHFPAITDLKFTAEMESSLDEIASGKKEWRPLIKDFYGPFKKNLKKKEKEVDKKKLTEEKTKEKCEKCKKPMVIKMGRFGKFLACSGYPDCKNTKPIGKEGERQEKLKNEYANVKCEKCGAPMVVKRGRFGEFLGCSKYPECKTIKPIEKKTDVKCPKCKEGDIIEKRTKKGRTFFACNKFPKCEFALWQKPVADKKNKGKGIECPKCKSLLVYAAKGKMKCSKKECDYIKSSL